MLDLVFDGRLVCLFSNFFLLKKKSVFFYVGFVIFIFFSSYYEYSEGDWSLRVGEVDDDGRVGKKATRPLCERAVHTTDAGGLRRTARESSTDSGRQTAAANPHNGATSTGASSDAHRRQGAKHERSGGRPAYY